MKIAVILSGDPNDRKGAFNSTHNRIKELKKNINTTIDVYIIQIYDGYLTRKIKKKFKKEKNNSFEIDNIKYTNLWFKFSIIDYILTYKFNYKDIFLTVFLKTISKLFIKYDIISAHSYECGYLAYLIKLKFNIPYTITWHGSEIHTSPFINTWIKKKTKKVIENADYNFFVSKDLLEVSEKIGFSEFKTVLYNGVSEEFIKYKPIEIEKLKNIFDCKNKHIVAFVGGLVPVKNIQLLPSIFENIIKKEPNTEFWIIGDGKMRISLEFDCKKKNLPVKFWGNVSTHFVIELMNCMNVLILPSKYEGLPLVTLEALACGVQVVGSRVGGIPEAIGIENTCILNSNFANNIADMVVAKLTSNNQMIIGVEFNWNNTSRKEFQVYENLIKKRAI